MVRDGRDVAGRDRHAYMLVTDVSTRFNSICLVFPLLLLLRTEIDSLCSEESLNQNAFSSGEWFQIISVNKVIEEVKKVCEGSSGATISLLLPLIETLCKDILDLDTLHQNAVALCAFLHTKINTRVTSMPDFALASVLLDPRIRNKSVVSAELQGHAEAALRKKFYTWDSGAYYHDNHSNNNSDSKSNSDSNR